MPKYDLSLYARVVQVTHIYLGPAADRFIDRQIQNHIGIKPSALSGKDLIQLTDWLRLSMSLLTEDSEVIEEYTLKLQQLIDQEKGTI